MEISNILEKIGLTKNESVLYETALKYGSQPASILARRANLNRATTYSSLKTLISKRLISQIIKPEGTYFSAKDPEYLSNFLENQKESIDKKKILIDNNLDLIKGIMGESSLKPKFSIYEGTDGIKQIHEDILSSSKNETILEFIPQNMLINNSDDYMLDDFSTKRVKNNIFAKIIAPESDIGYKIQTSDKDKMRETKIVPKDNYNFESEITIYKNKVAMISYKPEENLGVIIESQSISKTLKQIFNLLWNTSNSFVLNQVDLF